MENLGRVSCDAPREFVRADASSGSTSAIGNELCERARSVSGLARLQVHARDPARGLARRGGVAREHERVVTRDHVGLGAREPLERVVALDHVGEVVEDAEYATGFDVLIEMSR